MKRVCLVITSVIAGLAVMRTGASPPETQSLAGEWRFALDRADAGIQEKWFERVLPDRLRLPGVLQAQGYGDEVSTDTPWVLSLYDRLWFEREEYRPYTQPGKTKVPFLCQPPRHYLGAAWYQRDIEIPKEWEGKHLVLFLERPRWESRVWLDDRLVGTNNSLCAPHEFDLGPLAPGKHQLTLRLDNRMLMKYRPDAHAVSDSLGSTWNGIAGRIELVAHDPVRIEHVRLEPSLERKGVVVKLALRNDTPESVEAQLVMLQVVPKNFGGNALKPVQTSATIKPGISELDLFFPMGEKFETWSEFNPKFYGLLATIGGKDFHSEAPATFGMREFKAVGQDFVLNGVPTHLRGTHHGGDFPLTGYPPCDFVYWRRIFLVCREWGLNHVRFHSFCPPEAAFMAADDTGIYLQIEPGMWNELSPGTPMEQMLYDETERILKYYGNHPSFVLMSASNEPKGAWKRSLPKWVEHFRSRDARHLYTTGTGWSLIDEPGPVNGADYLAVHRIGQHMLRGERGWFGRDYAASLAGVNVPVVSHELGQWCAYPDFAVINKFTGYARPGNLDIFHDSAATQGVLPFNRQFARASARFQFECYKEEVEANLRTPGLGGFQLLDLHDYTGQGTALVGILDPFWEPKGAVSAAEWRRFCDPVVPLARLAKRVFTSAEKFEAEIEVANFGPRPITNATLSWWFETASGKALAHEEIVPGAIAVGRTVNLGKASAELAGAAAPAACRLRLRLVPGTRTFDHRPGISALVENEWNLWVYPAEEKKSPEAGVVVTRSWKEAERSLAQGGKVLFLPRSANLDWRSPPLDKVPVFWNRLMNPQWGRMLGLWCDMNHPALTGFPTREHCDWQWTQLTPAARAVNIGSLPPELRPIVAAIDDWNRNWRLAPVFEAKVGEGKLVVCAFDIATGLEERVVARQLRHSLLSYMAGARFQPPVALSAEQLRGLWFDTLVMRKLGAVAESTSGDARAAIDGDPNTFWSAGGGGRSGDGRKHPHVLTVKFPAPVAMAGVTLMNRQNDRDHLGDIRAYRIELSDNGERWREVAAGDLPSTWSPQTVRFPETQSASRLRLTGLSGYGTDSSAALAEIAVLYAGPELPDNPDGVEYRRVRSTSSDVDEGAKD